MIYGKTNVQPIAMKADRSSAMVSLNTLQTTVSLNIYKNSANKFGRKTGFKIENKFEDHNQSIPKFTGILTELRCIFGQNLKILTSTGGEWSCGQAQNSVNFDFQVKFDFEGQGQSTPKTTGISTKMFCVSGSNLVILAGTSHKLSRGQAHDWHYLALLMNVMLKLAIKRLTKKKSDSRFLDRWSSQDIGWPRLSSSNSSLLGLSKLALILSRRETKSNLVVPSDSIASVDLYFVVESPNWIPNGKNSSIKTCTGTTFTNTN